MKRKRFWGAAIMAVCVLIVVIVYNFGRRPIPHLNPVDLGLSLYSSKNITQNAVSTDLHFQNIAFNTEPSKRLPFSNQVAAVARSLKLLIEGPSQPTNDQKEYSTWLWTPVMQMTPEYIDSVLAEAGYDGINTIYISIDSYLDIFTMEKGQERAAKKAEFENKLDYFVSQAASRGIAVYSEAGWQNWAEEGNQYKAVAVINFVKTFNATHSNKFSGFQYDVEPYLLDKYHEDPAGVLKNFVALADQTEKFLEDSDLKLSIVVPDFYDGKDQITPKFSYNGNNDFTFGHLLGILDQRPGNSIVIMSYRNFAEGKDGSIEISQNEMQTAKSRMSPTKIIIAQETGEFPPLYITFHHTSRKYLLRELNQIDQAFAAYPNFGGLALHYVNSVIELK